MATKIFVNLPVKDLKRLMNFFTHLGFSFNTQFTDDKAACLVINDGSIYAMLLTDAMFWQAYFGTCTDKFGINWMFNHIKK